MLKTQKIVLDSSIIIDGKVPEMIEKDIIEGLEEVIVPLATLDELQAQASKGRETGFIGLDEIKKIRFVCEEKNINLRFTGERPSLEDIKLARGGRLDALIRDVAKDESATLLTADYVQGLVGEAEGVKVEYMAEEPKGRPEVFDKYFTDDTMSVHLKEGVVPMAKRGKPGDFKLQKIGENVLSREYMQKMISDIIEFARKTEDSFIEAESGGAVVIQIGTYRIAIAKPPFSDGYEITIVRPIVKLTINDYKLSERLMKRLKEKAEGVLVAGPPGSGKSTFVASLAEFYQKQDVVIKTLESPRDLQVGPEITQYGPLAGDFAKSADILLLVRPDYTIFDEVRMDRHFRVFADMRLSGIGMVGVVHASEAIDAIQRFMGKIELGMIPHVVDTVIFIKDGEVKNVLELSLTVKVPSGMTEADLARPVVDVRDFETGKLFYEIYSYGEENVVVPVKEEKKDSALERLAKKQIMQVIRRYDPSPEIRFLGDNKVEVKVDNSVVGRLIGKDGVNIAEIEDSLGIKVDVEPKVASTGKPLQFRLEESGNSFVFDLKGDNNEKPVSIYIEDNFIMSATVSRKNDIRINRSSEIGREILKAIINNKKIRVLAG